MFGCGSLMSSRDGVRCVNSWEFQSRTSHFQDCKFSISLSKWFSADIKYRNDTQSMRRRHVKRVLCGASLWVGYLGLGAGFLYLLFNPQAVTRLFSASIIGRRISGITGWSSWGGLNVYFVLSDYVILLLSENMFLLDRGWARISIS